MKFTCVFFNQWIWLVCSDVSKWKVRSLWGLCSNPIMAWMICCNWFYETISSRQKNMDMNGFGFWFQYVYRCMTTVTTIYNIYVFYNLIIQSSHARWRTTTSIETNIFHPFPINGDVSSIYWQIRFSFHTASSRFTNMIVFHKNLSYGNITKLLVKLLCLSFAKSCLFLTCAQLPQKNKLHSC